MEKRFFYSPRLIVHFGGIITHGTEKLKASINGGDEYHFRISTKIEWRKSNNWTTIIGKIVSTPHGYWNLIKSMNIKINKDFIKAKLNTSYDDFIIETEEVKMSKEDMQAKKNKFIRYYCLFEKYVYT